jgi:hypothetical protein
MQRCFLSLDVLLNSSHTTHYQSLVYDILACHSRNVSSSLAVIPLISHTSPYCKFWPQSTITNNAAVALRARHRTNKTPHQACTPASHKSNCAPFGTA